MITKKELLKQSDPVKYLTDTYGISGMDAAVFIHSTVELFLRENFPYLKHSELIRKQ